MKEFDRRGLETAPRYAGISRGTESPDHQYEVDMAIVGLRNSIAYALEMAAKYPELMRKDGTAIALCADDLSELAGKIAMKDAAE